MSVLLRRVSLLLFLILISAGYADAARELAPQRECTTCHIMWLDELRQEVVRPLIDVVAMNKVMAGGAADERVCLSCHDGFVLDSRFVWTNREYFHPVGVKPSEKVNIPVRKDGTTPFPLDMNGRIYCGTCHSAHGRKWEGEKDSPIFLRESNRDSMMCMICHIDRATGPAEGNHPVNKDTIDLPQAIFDAGGKKGQRPNQVVCQSCHRVHGASAPKLLIVDNANSALCGICHKDRYAKDRDEAESMATHPVNLVSDRVKIAGEVIDKGGKIGPNGEIICQTCHRPHFANWDAKLLVMENKDSNLCKTCHADKGSVAITKHNLNITAPNEPNVRDKTVLEGGPCSACHVPHRGKGAKMWARVPSEKGDAIARLCFSCHFDGKVAEKKQVGKYTHPTMVNIKGADGDTELPLFSEEGVRLSSRTDGNVTCGTCHNVHQWDPKDPKIGAGKETVGNGSNKFLRKPFDSKSTLCMECHSDKNIVGSDHDMQATARNEKNILGRTTAENGPCSACHLPHNGTLVRMWAKETQGDGDPVSRLCKSCHSEGKAASLKQLGRFTHPVGVQIANIGIKPIDKDRWVEGDKVRFGSATSWLNIKALPLFDADGRRSVNGAVTCATCHNPHQWDPKVVKEGPGKNIEGDGYNSFLRIANNPDSSLCRNCHYQRSVFFSKHNLQITSPAEKNIAGDKVSETGPCSACHLPHNGSNIKMWGRKLSGEEDIVSQLCKSCHSKGKAADKKTVGEYSHPVYAGISKVGGVSSLPLFFDSGVKEMKDGRVVCATCHNVHQWDTNDPNSTSGARKDIEGDITNSFLRISPSLEGGLCVDCHKEKRFVMRTKHDLNISAPKALNQFGQTVAQSGPCLSCHSVHNAQTRSRLWGRKLGEGDSIPEMRCRSCHALGQVAEKKVPKNLKHPKDVIASSIGRGKGGDVPLYTKEGERKDSGIITCPTCHNPHQWSAAREDYGPGNMTEGNINDSFLRNLSPSIICSDCHGIDALFRYKYFHGDTSRKNYPLFGR